MKAYDACRIAVNRSLSDSEFGAARCAQQLASDFYVQLEHAGPGFRPAQHAAAELITFIARRLDRFGTDVQLAGAATESATDRARVA